MSITKTNRVAVHQYEVALQIEDRDLLASEAAKLNDEKKVINRELDEAKQTHKSETTKRDLRIEQILRAIHEKKELRPVECQVEYDDATNEALYMYDGKIVDRRHMTPDEMQAEFPSV